jgi:hypothetical protein
MIKNKWWKEATTASGEGYRPWDDAQASSFWRNMTIIKLTFLCSIEMQVGNGPKIKF